MATENNFEVGQTYPIFGTVTQVFDDADFNAILEINGTLRLRVVGMDKEQSLAIKRRVFESGIFVATIERSGDIVEGSCSMAVFGSQPEYHA